MFGGIRGFFSDYMQAITSQMDDNHHSKKGIEKAVENTFGDFEEKLKEGNQELARLQAEKSKKFNEILQKAKARQNSIDHIEES